MNGPRFAIEIRERYGNVVRDRWPVSVDPLPNEVLSSWLHRLALANGLAPRSFADVLGLRPRMSPRLELRLPRHVAALLAHQTGVSHKSISAMSMTGDALTALLLPLRENSDRNRSSWMQYCPLCLADDDVPYFRRHWRLASRISCFEHVTGLRDRCPSCRSGIASFNQGELIPQHFCARCGFDLRSASKTQIKAAARRLERSIEDICRVELAKRPASVGDLISRLLGAPVAADLTSAKSLTNLSASMRIRCFERLASDPHDWLITDKDVGAAYWRRMILAAGGHQELIARFADALEKQQGSPRPKRSPPEGADLSSLLEAYWRMHAEGPRRGKNG
ncbi:TniQ family protein [Bosea vaviloviae]|uniref:TniQ domain-containing protein n=1 Tax=Bosea vaviloviae TaxID=1526658 RepID=A0A1D7UCJ5_9HYPH|nr:TniQ family protein [Bosea vaviloviae]AOO85098.1 hypothetical protein BHK69_30860 [Bosea vaviloviae]